MEKPIFKSGSRSEANSYRPISVVSVFSRILEKIVHNQIYEYLKATKALTMSQSAFQKCCSTVTSLIDSTDNWYENIDNKQLNLTIFLDLKKVLNTVNQKILLEKLKKYGFRDIAGDWLQSYLEDRKQYCAANGFESGTKAVTCGIPQGSCLGPLLFIIEHSLPVRIKTYIGMLTLFGVVYQIQILNPCNVSRTEPFQ